MGMENKIDYDLLLGEWANIVNEKARKYTVASNKAKPTEFNHGYYKGKCDGIYEAFMKVLELEKIAKQLKKDAD
jgi:hypothetical protein